MSVMAWSSTAVDVSHMHTSLMCVMGSHVCIKACVFLQVQRVFCCWDVLPTGGIVQKVLGKRNGFGDDVVAVQPPHSCLVVHNTVCHVTPCASFFLLNREWNSVPARNACCVCGDEVLLLSFKFCKHLGMFQFTECHMQLPERGRLHCSVTPKPNRVNPSRIGHQISPKKQLIELMAIA